MFKECIESEEGAMKRKYKACAELRDTQENPIEEVADIDKKKLNMNILLAISDFITGNYGNLLIKLIFIDDMAKRLKSKELEQLSNPKFIQTLIQIIESTEFDNQLNGLSFGILSSICVLFPELISILIQEFEIWRLVDRSLTHQFHNKQHESLRLLTHMMSNDPEIIQFLCENIPIESIYGASLEHLGNYSDYLVQSLFYLVSLNPTITLEQVRKCFSIFYYILHTNKAKKRRALNGIHNILANPEIIQHSSQIHELLDEIEIISFVDSFMQNEFIDAKMLISCLLISDMVTIGYSPAYQLIEYLIEFMCNEKNKYKEPFNAVKQIYLSRQVDLFGEWNLMNVLVQVINDSSYMQKLEAGEILILSMNDINYSDVGNYISKEILAAFVSLIETGNQEIIEPVLSKLLVIVEYAENNQLLDVVNEYIEQIKDIVTSDNERIISLMNELMNHFI